MSRRGRYALWLIGVAVLFAAVIALSLAGRTPVGSACLLSISLYWLWNGILLMADIHPEWGNWDRWERQAYGLAFAAAGLIWAVLAWSSRINEWPLLLAGLVIPILIAVVGRRWYVERKRSDDYRKNQTERD